MADDQGVLPSRVERPPSYRTAVSLEEAPQVPADSHRPRAGQAKGKHPVPADLVVDDIEEDGTYAIVGDHMQEDVNCSYDNIPGVRVAEMNTQIDNNIKVDDVKENNNDEDESKDPVYAIIDKAKKKKNREEGLKQNEEDDDNEEDGSDGIRPMSNGSATSLISGT